jgi:twitching motility two-component system response regulator PilH
MKTPTILLAEDDRFLRRAAEVALKKRGFAVVLACDGVEALEKVRAHKPTLLLLDLLMPRMTGMDVLQAIRVDADPEVRETRILILSNSSKELEMHSAETLGVTGYWIKANLSLQELGDRVEALLTPVPDEADPGFAHARSR